MTKKVTADDCETMLREGSYISGLSMQGARWNMNDTSIEKSRPKEMFCAVRDKKSHMRIIAAWLSHLLP